MVNYFTIEKYKVEEEINRVDSRTRTIFDVQQYTSKKALEQGLLKGPQHGGRLIVAKEVSVKLELMVDEQ